MITDGSLLPLNLLQMTCTPLSMDVSSTMVCDRAMRVCGSSVDKQLYDFFNVVLLADAYVKPCTSVI